LVKETDMNKPEPRTGIAAGVPYLAVPPGSAAGPSAPVVIAWHLMDSPRTESAFAAALPLQGLEAWRIYLGLPMYGARMPAGGMDELMRLAYEDAVLNLHGPIAEQAAAEFAGAFAELRDRLHLSDGPLAIVGGSLGSAVAQLVIAEAAPAAGLAVEAAVLISPVAQLQPMVEAAARHFGATYAWGERSLEFAARLDFVARADETVRAGQPAVRLIVGENDDREGFLEPAQRLRAALSERYDDASTVDLVVVPGMAHALAEEPGIEPAPQTSYAATVDRFAVEWLERYLLPAETCARQA
jgi:pimeloyl-ACP methyl ester carboxylesterase